MDGWTCCLRVEPTRSKLEEKKHRRERLIQAHLVCDRDVCRGHFKSFPKTFEPFLVPGAETPLKGR